MTSGGSAARTVPEFGDGDLELREQFEQIAFELLVGAIDLVDQQDGRPQPRRVDCLQQRALDEEGVAVQLSPGRGPVQITGRLENAQFDELPCVVPLVHRVRDVQTFIALEPDQVRLERGGHCAGQGGLADAGLALQEQRATETKREEEGDGQPVVGDVVLRGQTLTQVVDRVARGSVHGSGGA